MGEFFQKLFDTSDYPARWDCGNWSEFAGWLHILSDIAIFMAYAAIPISIAWFAFRKRTEIVFPKLYWFFAAFILSCGMTHLNDAIIFWHPIYRFAGLVKFITAIASWATVIALFRTLPVALALPGTTRLNQALQKEIEDRKNSEEALKESSTQLKLAIEHSRLGDWSWEPATDRTRFSPRALEIFGLPPDSTKQWAEISLQLPLEDRTRMQVAVREAFQNHTDYDIEYRVIRPDDGREVWISARGRGQYSPEGTGMVMVGTVQDVTERKRIEAEREQLLLSERLAREEAERAGLLKDEFIATLSHELRTPLNAIVGWAHLLHGEHNPEQIQLGLEVIERNSRLQSDLVGDLLDMNQIITGKLRLNLQPVDLRLVINEAVESAHPSAHSKNIHLATHFAPDIQRVAGDPSRLQQIIWNLLTNAIKFTPADGNVDIHLQNDGSRVEVVVTDSGPGIPAEFVPFVFDRFRQADSTTMRKHGGLGLGLAIVKNLVEVHGGTVSAEGGGDGRGATFRIHLPSAANASNISDEPARSPSASAVH